MPSRRLGFAAFAAQPFYVVVELAVAAAVVLTASAPYSLVRNTISDLGARRCGSVDYPLGPVEVCSPGHAVLNAGFVIAGALLVTGAVLTASTLPRGGLRSAAVTFWIVSGLSSIATGLVPIDVDLDLHTLVSAPVFLAQPVAHLCHALALRHTRPGLSRWGVALAVLSLAAGVVFTVWTGGQEYGGLLERLTLWPAYLWLGALGLIGLRRPGLLT